MRARFGVTGDIHLALSEMLLPVRKVVLVLGEP